MEDVIARYRAATEARDIDAIMATFEPDAELLSPISGRMVFRGAEDLRVLTAAVYGTIEPRWVEEGGSGRLRLLIGGGRVGPFRVDDAMVLELSERGLIQRIRPHFRPWLGLTAFAIAVGPKMLRHPGVMVRALRRAR
jgi:hypothetical protein